MQNGDELWFIDMAQADHSMFYKATVPKGAQIRFSYNNS